MRILRFQDRFALLSRLDARCRVRLDGTQTTCLVGMVVFLGAPLLPSLLIHTVCFFFVFPFEKVCMWVGVGVSVNPCGTKEPLSIPALHQLYTKFKIARSTLISKRQRFWGWTKQGDIDVSTSHKSIIISKTEHVSQGWRYLCGGKKTQPNDLRQDDFGWIF